MLWKKKSYKLFFLTVFLGFWANFVCYECLWKFYREWQINF